MALSAGAGAALGAGISAGGGIGSNLMNIHQAGVNRDFARDMYWTQRKHADQDWKRNAEYNHPKQQLARMREAGLNPLLAYGKTGISQPSAPQARGSASGTPSSPAIQNPTAQAGPILAQMQSLKIQEQDVRGKNKVRESEILKNISQSEFTDVQKEQMLELFGLKKAGMQADLDKTNVQIENYFKDLDVKDSQIALQKSQAAYNEMKTAQGPREVDAKLQIASAAMMNAKANKAKAARQIMLMGVQAEGLKAQMALNNAKTATEKQRAKEAKQKINLVQAQFQNLNMSSFDKAYDLFLKQEGINPNAPWFITATARLGNQIEHFAGHETPMTYLKKLEKFYNEERKKAHK